MEALILNHLMNPKLDWVHEKSIQALGHQIIQKYFYHQRRRETFHCDEQLPVKTHTQGQHDEKLKTTTCV